MDVREKEQRNAKYNEYVEQITPKNNLFAVCFKAFILGGSICLLGQIIVNIALNMGVFILNLTSSLKKSILSSRELIHGKKSVFNNSSLLNHG